jgi:putative ABC transport system permease protein
VNGLPRWACALIRGLAPPGELDDVLGDLEEARRRHLQRRGRVRARLLTTIETIELAIALLRARGIHAKVQGSSVVQDYKLGLRMLIKYPGLTIAGGLALAIAIGIGAGWFDLSRDLFRPRIPLPEGERIVEVEMRNSLLGADERRILHDLDTWKRDARSVTELGAYRTLERNMILGNARPEPVTVAEITASAFTLTRVPPLLGRPLLDADERPGAEPVVVLGYSVWQRQFAGRHDVIGATLQLGRTPVTIVGVMPEGYAFPINHRMWVPLQLSPAGHDPLDGPPVRVFARLAPGVTQAQANAELMTMAEATAAASPETHEHLRPRVLAYGGESPGDRSIEEFLIRHLPVLLVLLVACANVGTLVYARTATREAEIAMRHALGAGRWRIILQLFVEALVLASVAAVVGLLGAHYALKWGVNAYFSSATGGLPFWINPGLKPMTVVFATGLTVLGAALLGVLPALKATTARVHIQLRSLGAGGATLRFGKFWTSAMIGQVALAVICLPPAAGISHEAFRDRMIREAFPAREYLTVRLDLDRESDATTTNENGSAAFARRFQQTYDELERRLLAEPGVRAVTYGDRLPGMGPAVRTAEVAATDDSAPRLISNLWLATAGPRYFDAFGAEILSGRDFHESERLDDARAVIVNEAFARRYLAGASPVGARVRFASNSLERQEPWFEIVGMVRDIGMTPTDLGEAPYMFRPATPATVTPLVMGVRVAGDPVALAPRLRDLAFELDPGLRLSELRALDAIVWDVDVPMMIGAGAVITIVSLALFLSAAGIFALVSVSVARRTREIGLRAALGASRALVLKGVLTHAAGLIGAGVLVGNGVLMLVVSLSDEIAIADIIDVLAIASSVMLLVGLVACVEPARRALRIQPIDALKEA